MFGEAEYLDMFTMLYTSAMHGLRLKLLPTAPADSPSPPPWLADADMDSGKLAHPWVSSLSAFWPALQALAGQPTSPMPAGLLALILRYTTCSDVHCCSCTKMIYSQPWQSSDCPALHFPLHAPCSMPLACTALAYSPLPPSLALPLALGKHAGSKPGFLRT